MSGGFVWRPAELAETLRRGGYDVDEHDAAGAEGGSLAGRRERGDRVQLVVVDAGGRFRAEVTALVAETAARVEIAGVALRLVETEQRLASLTGDLPNAAALGGLLAALDALGSRTPSPSGQRGELPPPP